MSPLKTLLRAALGLLAVAAAGAEAGSERTPSSASTERRSTPTGSEPGAASGSATQRGEPKGRGRPYPPAPPYGRPPPLDPATAHYWSEKCVSQRASSLPIHTADCDNPAYSTGRRYYPGPYPYPTYPPPYGGGRPFLDVDRYPSVPQPPEPPSVPEYRPQRLR